MFSSLITQRSGRRCNAACRAEASTPEWEKSSDPVEYSESLAPWVFCKLRIIICGTQDGCARTRFVYFSIKITYVAVGKRKVMTTKEQRTAQAACTTISTEPRAQRTAHFVAGRNPASFIYFSTFRRMRLTALWLARHIYM